MTNKVLSIIPARGGSKGLPRKNVLPLGGKPVISWTIDAALKSRTLSSVIVTTDDSEIASIAENAGAELPFMRPNELASDTAPMVDTVIHALLAFEHIKRQTFEAVALLQPTCPLRTPRDIDGSVELLYKTGADSVITVHKVDSAHPYYMYRLKDGAPEHIMAPPSGLTRRQDYEDIYLRNGLVYVTRREVLLEQKSFYGKSQQAFVTDPMRSVNIDTQTDFDLAAFHLAKYGTDV